MKFNDKEVKQVKKQLKLTPEPKHKIDRDFPSTQNPVGFVVIGLILLSFTIGFYFASYYADRPDTERYDRYLNVV